MPTLRVLRVRIDYPKGAGERDAHSTSDARELRLGVVTVGEIERRPRREEIQDRPQRHLLVELQEFLNALLQPLVIGRSKGSMTLRPFALAAV